MKCGAIIIENRFNVREVIEQHAEFIPPTWQIVHVNNPNIKTLNDYNKLLTMRKFWEDIPFDKVLIFQHSNAESNISHTYKSWFKHTLFSLNLSIHEKYLNTFVSDHFGNSIGTNHLTSVI